MCQNSLLSWTGNRMLCNNTEDWVFSEALLIINATRWYLDLGFIRRCILSFYEIWASVFGQSVLWWSTTKFTKACHVTYNVTHSTYGSLVFLSTNTKPSFTQSNYFLGSILLFIWLWNFPCCFVSGEVLYIMLGLKWISIGSFSFSCLEKSSSNVKRLSYRSSFSVCEVKILSCQTWSFSTTITSWTQQQEVGLVWSGSQIRSLLAVATPSGLNVVAASITSHFVFS